MLANPSCFSDIVVQPGEKLFLSKRDASSYFDVLRAPPELWQYFGRPRVTLRELHQATGASMEELRGYLHGPSTRALGATVAVYPCSVTWPQGFSWSSTVAQRNTISICQQAGVDTDNILSPDRGPPANQSELCMICTDDTLFFHRDSRLAHDTLRRFEAAAAASKVPLNNAKDITVAERMTALGCDVETSPPRVSPDADKLRRVLGAALDVLNQGTATPASVRGWLGTAQWFCLLERWLFGIFNHIYAFVRTEEPEVEVPVPLPVQNEIALFVALAPMLVLPLTRQAHPDIYACDAAPEHGFGVTAARCSLEEAEQLCRLSEKRHDFVRPAHDENDPSEIARAGVLHRLSIPQKRFRTIVGKPARWTAHSGALEAHALLLVMRHATRAAAVQNTRLPCLVDAKVVICAAAKGRSSAPTIRTTLRRTGAFALAAGVSLKVIYVPSEANPSDGPSRGYWPGHH